VSNNKSFSRLVRWDIQALRGLAVLLVFLSHVGMSWFEGGYIGVDIFFVISGYVITKMLLDERYHFGRVSFLSFYSRRLMRLLPAFVVMVAVVCLISYLVLSPDDTLWQLNDAAYANLWISNFRFLYADVDYFSLGAQGSLFLHTWSLSVEEQFYVVWPFVFALFVYKLRLRICAAVFIAFFMYYAVMVKLSPGDAFYFPIARFWQFSLGAAIVYFNQGIESRVGSLFFWDSLLVLKILAIGGILISSGPVNFNLYYSVLPSFLTAILLVQRQAFRSAGGRPPFFLMPFVWLGNVSYSFYLWHWPVIEIGERLSPVFGVEYHAVIYFILSLVCAFVSYWVVENPFRFKLAGKCQSKVLVLCAVGVIAICQVGLTQSDRFVSEKFKKELVSIDFVRDDLSRVYYDKCDSWYASSRLNPCVYGDDSAEHSVVLFGDSVLLQWFPAIEAYFSRRGWKVVVLTKSACAMPHADYYYPKINSVYHVCREWKENVFHYLEELEPALVVVGGDTSYDISDKGWDGGTREALRRLEQVSDSVLVVGDNPSMPFDAASCLSRMLRIRELLPSMKFDAKACTSSVTPIGKNQITESVVRDFRNTRYVNVDEVVCPGRVCRSLRGNVVVFRDPAHITSSFARISEREFVSQMERELSYFRFETQ
jgi:peptidoglycan/LPS O-acetylase OafA/YrhL